MATVFACGFECRAGHFTLSGSTSYSTTTFRSGLSSLRFNPSASAAVNQAISANLGGSTEIFRFYIRFATLPGSNVRLAGYQGRGLYFQSSDNSLRCGVSFASFGSTGAVVTTDVWYRVDLRILNDTTTTTVDANINGEAIGQASISVNETFGQITLECTPNVVNVTADVFFDDFLFSQTAGDYPLGPGYVLSYIPNADGTHNVAGANDFERSLTGTDITNSTTDAYQLIDDRPLPTTAVDFINGIAPPNASDYVEWQYEDTVEGQAPRAVEAIIAVHDAGGAGTCAYSVTLRDSGGGTTADIFNSTQNVGGTITYRRAHFATIPGGAAWTQSAFNALRSRFLVSDASPDPYIDAAMLEAEYNGMHDALFGGRPNGVPGAAQFRQLLAT